ncbi:MAG: hypothetical protein EON87_17855 [Brevundimonas sp.]|nr:MAG: hypothetical protein EON87_17855 [Brevundimonas sp.]
MTKSPATIRFEKPLEQEVHRILWEEWDPIGVNTLSPLDTEYEGYVLRVAKRIREGESASTLAAYLGQVRAGWGENPLATSVDLTIAERLASLRLRRDWQ